MDEPAVRVATLGDESALARLDVLTWTSLSSPAPPPGPGYVFFDGVEPADVLVADVAGEPAGYVRLGAVGPLASRAHVVDVRGLAVHPGYGGRGLGRLLVGAAVGEARRRGARKVALRVLGHNAAARAVYRACGFVEEGVLRAEFRLDGRWVDDVLMAAHLPGPGRGPSRQKLSGVRPTVPGMSSAVRGGPPGRVSVPPSVDVVAAAVRESWSRETCDECDVDAWSPQNPARGQCGPTALTLHDLYGGALLLAEVWWADGRWQGYHWWNRLPDGHELDLTREQFGPDEVVQLPQEIDRPPGRPRRCGAQYELLRNRVFAALACTAHSPTAPSMP